MRCGVGRIHTSSSKKFDYASAGSGNQRCDFWSDVNITTVKTFQPSRNQLEDNPLIVSAAFGRGAVKIAFCILDKRS
jgi:hypothetical protein